MENKFELSPPEEIEGVICEEVLLEEVEQFLAQSAEMIQFCVEKGGIGLAAPQIGINKKFFIWQFKQELFQLAFNPLYFPDGKKTISTIESCLTYGTDKQYYMKRYKRIRAVYYGFSQKDKKLVKISKAMSGTEAIIFQHEMDHLKGKTIATEGKILTNG